jgi:uncharacterized protein YbjT (DUF2867 family)
MAFENQNSRNVVVTGAFSYTGKFVARLLLQSGYNVRTLTFHPERAGEFGGKIEAFPYAFDQPGRLVEALQESSCLINTYWIRFPRGRFTFETAVKNTITLIDAAKKAGVQRIVHISIANPSLDSPLGYYYGKAQVEKAIRESGLDYSILRPTVIFGREDILINNIAWFIRHMPVFGVPGDGRYSIRPIYVEDMARRIVDSINAEKDEIIDAVGPESFTFEGLIRTIAYEIGESVRIVKIPSQLAYISTCLVGWLVRDVVLTWEEYKGLTENLLASTGPSVGKARLTQWVRENRDFLGRKYASEIARHYQQS